MDSTATEGRRQLTLLDAQKEEWFKLPCAIMQDIGPATQTLAGLLRITQKETFCSTGAIANSSRLPTKTVRNHLGILESKGWITNAGREHTRAGAPRRTCTIRLTKKTRDSLDDFGVLPWWACCQCIRGGRRLSWSAKAVLSLVIARLMGLRAQAVRQNNETEEEIIDFIGNITGDGTWKHSLDALARRTGLSRESIVAAKRELHGHDLILWASAPRDDGGTGADLIAPNPAFAATITNLQKNQYCVDFDIADSWK